MFASKATDVLRIKKLNTLFLSYDGMTDNLGQSQVIPYLIGLSSSGYRITIISCEKEVGYKKNAEVISSLLQRHNIDWHPLHYTKKPPVLSTLWDIRKMKNKVVELHREKKFVLVHCRSYITTLAVLGFCERKSLPFVFDMRGFWADERVEGKIWSLKNPIFQLIFNYFKKKELEFVSKAAAVVSLTHAAKIQIQKWNISDRSKKHIFVIPCSADFDLFDVASSEEKILARKQAGFDQNEFVLVYLGSLGTWYMLEEMLDLFVVLKSQLPQSKFYIITNDSKELVLKLANDKGISLDSIVIDSAQRAEVPHKLAAADWGISFIQPSYSKKASSPTKMGELLAMGIPLIVNSKVGDVKEIIEQTKGGLCIDEFSVESFTKVVQQVRNEARLSSPAIRELSKGIYSLQNAVSTYQQVYKISLQEFEKA